MVVSKNAFLTLEEMTENAEHILSVQLQGGWTRNAICGILGNMQTESTINPGIWQNLISYDHDPYIYVASHGYGLVQWTPFNKYTVWARDSGLDYRLMNSQLARIDYEIANNIQWIPTSEFPYTFEEFKNSTSNPEDLAEWFLINYERPADQGTEQRNRRRTQARYWWDNLSGTGTEDPGEPDPTTPGVNDKLIHLLLSGALTGWK